MRFIRLIHIILSVILFDFAASANIYLSSLSSMNSDLSNDHITAICIDRYGFAWIGTASGLNRFDTHNIQTFREDDLGLHTDYVRSIYEDTSGDVWIGTDSGLSMYDRDMDIFVPISCQSDKGCSISKRVACIGEGGEGKIWISVGDQGLFSYDKETSVLEQFFYHNSRMSVERGISSFAFDGSGGILASLYQDNLYYFDKESLADGSYMEVGPLSDYFSKDHITSVCHISSGNFAVTSLYHGLCVVNVRNGECKTLISNVDNSFIPSMVIFRDDRLFMATNDGLYIYNLSDNTVDHIQADPDNVHSLRSNDINYVEYSSEYGLWIGLTGTGGVNFSVPDNDKFEKVLLADGKESLNGANVTDFSYDQDRNSLYVSTSYKGILEYSFSDRSLTRLVEFSKPVESICCNDGIILIGSPVGLYEYDLTTGTLAKERAFNQINISRIDCLSDKSAIVIGTTLGLFLYDIEARSFDKVEGLGDCSITSFVDDTGGSLWISTMNDGVFRLDLKTGKVTEHYFFNPDDDNSIPNNKCSCVNIDNDGNIWVSTIGSGFCRIDGGKVARYNLKTHPNLPSNCFYGVINDKNGNYWAKTDKGLVKCDFSSGSFYVFDLNSGLLDNNLTNYAQWESISGELFFGSSDGFFSFDPDAFGMEHDIYDDYCRPVFTNLYLSGERKILAGDEGSPLAGSIDVTGRIDLGPEENSFTVTVSVCRLSNLSEAGIEYTLEGYDDGGQALPEDGVISYRNLPPGLYTLKVSGHAPLIVCIRPHWYLTSSAFILYFFILVAIIAMVARYFYALSARRTRRRQEEKQFDEKLTFFSNVIHEIGTPIMLIKSSLKHLLESDNIPAQYTDDTGIIRQNVDYLSRLVRELLDYIRNEKNRYAINIVPVNLDDILDRLKLEFAGAAAGRNLNLNFTVPGQSVVVMADESSLTKIFNNLLHNAVKYAGTKIDVSVSENRERGEVKIVIANDGDTIPEDRREEIFKPFVQYVSKDSAVDRRGFGIGLAFARNLATGLGGSLVLGDDKELISFVLTLKLAPPEAGLALQDQESGVEDAGCEETILVVEDSSRLCEYLQKRLSGKYQVVIANNTGQAYEILKRRRISLVISDISLPGASGLELCEKISTSFEYSHIPVIIMSSFTADDIKVKAINNGAVLFLEKPFDMDYLAANVENLLNKSVVTTEGVSKPLSQKLKLLSQSDKLFLAAVDNYIKDNISDVLLNNESMARHLNISVPTLQRKVKSLTGLTPNRYIRKYRMDAGAQLLATGKCLISEISYNVGFNSASYFSKCFKEEYGCLPQEYVRKVLSDKVDL